MIDKINDLVNLTKIKQDQEEKYQAWLKKINAKIKALNAEIIPLMTDNSIKTEQATIIKTVRPIATANTEEFTNWLKEDTERLKYATVKVRQREIDGYVKKHGTVPDQIIKYERGYDLVVKFTF